MDNNKKTNILIRVLFILIFISIASHVVADVYSVISPQAEIESFPIDDFGQSSLTHNILHNLLFISTILLICLCTHLSRIKINPPQLYAQYKIPPIYQPPILI